MNRPVTIRVYEGGKLIYSTDVVGPVELGRQRAGERGWLLKYKGDANSAARVVISPHDDGRISRRHALMEVIAPDRIQLKNLSATLPIAVDGAEALPPGGVAELALPRRLTFGPRTVQIEGPEPPGPALTALEQGPVAPGPAALNLITTSRLALTPGARVDPESIVRWLQAIVAVVQSAAISKDFFDLATQAAVEVAGLESAALLLREGDGFRSIAFWSKAPPEAGVWRPSQRVLDAVCEDKRTLWQKPDADESLAGVDSVVAAPLLDREGRVVGVLYGDRRSRPGDRNLVGTSRLEASLVELVACAVAAGLARLEQEQAAVAARVRFEQFFTPELARQLEAEPDLLKGKDTEVTILVVDIRGFSRICERLGAARTFDWIRDMMGALSASVLVQQGVLVDYVGDELMAMWGAPLEQPDHAERACRAAMDMLRELPNLNDRWGSTIGEAVDIGIGINTGLARVGNVGSNRKFKYGPLGNTVNVASRVQGATKFLKTRAVVTGATRTRVGNNFQARRLCKARVVNIAEPVELYELLPPDETGAFGIQRFYERALLEFEAGRFREATRLLGKSLSDGANDGPSLVLMARAIECLVAPPLHFDAVWTLPGK
jgi:adenylate cyclase